MGKKKKSESGKKSKTDKAGGSAGDHVCGGCKNFDPDRKGGYCTYRDKKRSASEKACGNFKAV